MRVVKSILFVLPFLFLIACAKNEGKNPVAETFDPTADFTFGIVNSATQATVSFSNASSHATDYVWDFGDNSSSTQANPQHIYVVSGTYGVKLTAKAASKANSVIKNITITIAAPGKYFPLVKQIIQNNCLSCHSSNGAFTGRPMQFDTDTQIVAAYASIKAAVADSVTFTNKRMPQGGSLSQGDIDIIVNWFNKGGKLTD